jgi:predicted dehydrogenase
MTNESQRLRLRVAVVGCGPIGQLHAQAAAQSDLAELVAVCDVDAERAANLAERWHVAAFDRLERLIEEQHLDGVTIATPDHLHMEPALAAIAAGCHVFCEKPLAATAAEAERLVRAAEERGVALGVDYNRRFGFGYRTARRLVDEGAIGRVESCLVRVTDPVPPPAVARHPYVMFTTLLTHHLDLARWFGGEIRGIFATAPGGAASDVLRHVSLSMDLDCGAIAMIVAHYRDGQRRTSERMEIIGSGGSIAVEDVTRRVVLTGHDPDRSQVFEPDFLTKEGEFYNSLVEHALAFFGHVARGEAPPVTGRDGLAGLRAAETAIELLKTGRRVEVSAS